MNGWEIAILVIVCLAFATAVGIIIYNKIKGKSCCGDCNGCSGCAAKNKTNKAECNVCPHCVAEKKSETEKQ